MYALKKNTKYTVGTSLRWIFSVKTMIFFFIGFSLQEEMGGFVLLLASGMEEETLTFLARFR